MTDKDYRPRILHLAFEDYRRPWAGGGSLRTHEINRILANRYDITVLCSSYPGSKPRIEDGVHYQHIGGFTRSIKASHRASQLAYFAALPRAIARRRNVDLILEDFAAPFGSVGVPAWTRIPTVGIVQWLFARQQVERYHLPFYAVESLGLRTHRDLIAVSEDLASELLRRNSHSRVTVIPNGIESSLLGPISTTQRKDVLFLGRIDILQKGIDILVRAFALIVDTVDENLIIAGDGPDEAKVRRLVEDLGITKRVRFLGRVGGDSKRLALDQARILAVPSRSETFGIVAAEGLARGTPVIAFDIPCLREIVTPEVGVLVGTEGNYDPVRFGAALAEIVGRPDVLADKGRQGPQSVARFRWESAAAAQEAVYQQAIEESRAPHRRHHHHSPQSRWGRTPLE